MGFPQTAALWELFKYGSVQCGLSNKRSIQHRSHIGGSSHLITCSWVRSQWRGLHWLQVLPSTCGSPWSTVSFKPDSPALPWASPCAVALVSHGLQGNSPFHQGPLHGLQENFYYGAQSTSSPSFFIGLVVCRIISHSSLSHLLYLTETHPISLFGSALASSRSFLEPMQLALIWHGSASRLITEASAEASPATKPLSCKLNTRIKVLSSLWYSCLLAKVIFLWVWSSERLKVAMWSFCPLAYCLAQKSLHMCRALLCKRSKLYWIFYSF